MGEAGENLVPRAVQEVKANPAAEVEEGAKVTHVERVGREAKAGLAVGVGVRAKARRVVVEVRAEPGGLSHEVAVVIRATKGRGALAPAAAALLATTIT